MYRIDHDEQSGLIRAIVSGPLSETTCQSLQDDLRRAAAHQRRRTRALHILVDASRLDILPAEMVRKVVNGSAVCRSLDDRVAIVVQSSLVKLHLRAITDSETRFRIGTFLSANAARNWVLAYAEAAVA